MIQKIFKSVINYFKHILDSSEFGRDIMYDVLNQASFSNLYNHELMIADEVRLDFFHNGIKRYIIPGDTVLDLGTGSGILSFLAAQQNPKKIYAIDHSDFINVARQIAEHNNINNIAFVQTNSRDFNPDEKFDVILHEQVGHAIFDENMVENILDLKKRLLKETGKILPGKFELFLEPVCLKEGYKVPYMWENNIHGVDFRFLKNTDEISKYKSNGYSNRFIEHNAVDYFLCQPEACLSFDLNEITDEYELPKFVETSKRVILPGSMNGICLYFRIAFDEEIAMDTSPLHMRTSWKNVLFRTESKHYTIGEVVSFRLTMEVPYKIETWSLTLRV